MEKIRLKGGSLSGTYLCRLKNSKQFVRKEVSLISNREYGFQRWYSQLKRLQRYSILFPEIFPKLIAYGKTGRLAYFDIEYIPNSVTAHEFIMLAPDTASIDQFLSELIRTMSLMHKTVIPSTRESMDLYIYEEIEQKINACMGNARFREFVKHGEIYFNGELSAGLANVLDAYREIASDAYRNCNETFTHGNLTLENILYQPETGRVFFVDPYEENIIDSVLAEYSQIYQSSNSLYEIYNSAKPSIEGNRVDVSVNPNKGMAYFNTKFTQFLTARHDHSDLTMIRLFEVSQYARMLPFKMEIDEDKMLLFYALGSRLFHIARNEWAGKQK
jgi:hypothetical protein